VLSFITAIFLLFSWLDFPSEDEVRRPGPYKLTVVNNVVRVTTIPVMMVGKPIIKQQLRILLNFTIKY